jgi:phage baseplate assembly protein W
VAQLIRQVLLTTPGERAHRPDFGAGLNRMVFAPNDPATASLLQTTIFQNLNKWLGNIITVNNISVSADDATLNVTVAYVVKARGTQQVLNLEVTA